MATPFFALAHLFAAAVGSALGDAGGVGSYLVSF